MEAQIVNVMAQGKPILSLGRMPWMAVVRDVACWEAIIESESGRIAEARVFVVQADVETEATAP